ncbi:MAG: helix-turn-helix domain-containing protein [Solirubrobacteraceae bacterium]
MFDMRELAVAELPPLAPVEERALRLVAEGLAPRDVATRVGLPEDAVYRLVGWALEEIEPEPGGRTMADVHHERGSRPATTTEVAAFEQELGASLPADGEG